MLKHCPACLINWESGYTMPEDLILHNPTYYANIEAAEKSAALYGWAKENDKRFSVGVVGIELDRDRIEYWECTACHKVIDLAGNITDKEPFLYKETLLDKNVR